ncbi:MAG: D-isomer specific 2-hydroxyacid dehydrogenase family protein [Sphaerochaetaceae bacterium]
MMKVIAFSVRPEERPFFETYAKELGIDIEITGEHPTMETVDKAKGADAISIITTPIDARLISAFHDRGIRYISTRTIGFEHIDLEAAKAKGIGVGNVGYSPYSVAEYTIMLMLMCLRKMKQIQQRAAIQDFTLPGTTGTELHDKTVGVIGTGRMGRTVVSILKGFGCAILANDIHRDSEVAKSVSYVSLNELLKSSDIITLHVPATNTDSPLLGKEQFAMMKDKTVLINTARGSLIDQDALIAAIERGKIGAAALDVVQNEKKLYYDDCKGMPISDRQLLLLRSYPNVIITPHMAFHTQQAIEEMVKNSLASCKAATIGQGRTPRKDR